MLADPASGDDGNDDRGRRSGRTLVAWDEASASAVAARPGLRRPTSGYKRTASDPWLDLKADRRLGRSYDVRTPGNVVQGASTALTGLRGGTRLTLAIGFGRRPAAARATARRSLKTRFRSSASRYVRAWRAYLASLKRPPASVRRSRTLRRVYDQSLLVIAASEDKRNRGASVAAPNMPWVWGTLTLEKTEDSGPYDLVWPRDFYHVVTAQKVAGDSAAAARQLEYLRKVQKPDGSWWQNTTVAGEPHWTNLQLDEVSLPIVLAWWLGRRAPDDWDHIRRAADFIVANGPETEQERWENQGGWSPNTIAAEIAELVCAADVARRDGGDWDIFPAAERQTLGRLWPLLTGERGEYELLARRDARPHLRTIARTANDGLMLPEQVWDGRPPTGGRGRRFGEGTRSATPLAWTHAQFVRLAWSIAAGVPIERPSIVACRYTGSDC